MNRKLWSEAREIAGRHGAGRRRRPGAGFDRRGAGEGRGGGESGGLVGAGGAERGDRSMAGAAAAGRAGGEIDPPSSPIDPEAALLGRERRGLVRRALAALPRPQRRAALARFHADLPYEEVAARVGAPAITARTRVHRALASLRARLGALRAMFVFPGAQMSALGLVFVAAAAPGLTPARALSIDEISTAAPRAGRHFARTRVMAAASRAPAPAPQSARSQDRRLTGTPDGRPASAAADGVRRGPRRRKRRRARRRDRPDDAARPGAVADRDPAAIRAGDAEDAGRSLDVLRALWAEDREIRRSDGRAVRCRQKSGVRAETSRGLRRISRNARRRE